MTGISDVIPFAVGVLLAVGLYVAHRRGQFHRAVLLSLTLSLGTFVIALALVEANYRDAGGFMDCWPTCTAYQDAIAAGVFGPPLAVAVTVVAVLIAAVTAAVKRGLRASSR